MEDFFQINNATMLLRTCDLPAYGTQNDVGFQVDANGFNNCWTNLDLPDIIGSVEYEKNDYFEIQLVSIMQSSNFGSAYFGPLYLTMSGLPFINNYVFMNTSFANPTPPKMTQEVQFTFQNNPIVPPQGYTFYTEGGISNTLGGNINMPFSPVPCIFTKPASSFDLRLLAKSPDGTATPTGAILRKFAYVFKIRGIQIPQMKMGLALRGIVPSTTVSISNFNNINLKSALGVIWQNYDKFSISLATAINVGDTGFPPQVAIKVTLTGLDFIDSKNELTTKNKQRQTMGYFNFSNQSNTYACQKNVMATGVNFQKTSEMVNLQIQLWDTVTGLPVVWAWTRTLMYFFIIAPII